MNRQTALFTIEDKILKGPDYVYPEEWPSLGHFAFDKLSKNADFYGQFDIETGNWDKHREMKERAIKCAVWMRNNGVKAGDIVALFSTSHLDVSITLFATQFLGAIFYPVDRYLSEEELAQVFAITKPKLVFASQAAALILLRVFKTMDFNPKMISYGSIPGLDNYFRVIDKATEDDVEDFECEEIPSLDKTAVIMVTTSSVGVTKTFEISHRTVFREMYTSKVFDLEGDRFVTYSQISTLSGLLYTFASLLAKKTKILTPPFDHTKACRIIEKYKVDLVHLTDFGCEQIVKFGVHRKSDVTSVKRIVCGGGRNPLDFHRKLTRVIPHLEIFYGFGITEVAGTVAMPCINMRPGSSGRISENSQVKVVDLVSGEPLEKNETGELYVKSPSVLQSYYNDPESTKNSFDDEGWFRTGDIGYYDENGEVFVVGRRDELISYKDTRIYPRAIEAVLMSQPSVLDVAVVGVPHPTDNEHPIAFVVKMEDAEITEQDLIEIVASKVPEAHGLPGGVHFVQKLPRTTAEVIKRDELRARAKSIKESENVQKS